MIIAIKTTTALAIIAFLMLIYFQIKASAHLASILFLINKSR